jgi:hypothetical protein
MTDVVKKAKTANDVKNGGAVTSACPVFGNIHDEDLPYYKNPPVSGVNGVTTNQWDNRFDDTQYYST